MDSDSHTEVLEKRCVSTGSLILVFDLLNSFLLLCTLKEYNGKSKFLSKEIENFKWIMGIILVVDS